MVSNPVPLKSSCLQANVGDADAAIDTVPAPSSSVILVAAAIPQHTDPVRYRYACWVMVNSTVVYSTRFVDQVTLDVFIARVKTKLGSLMQPSSIVEADARSGTSTLPCPPPDDLAGQREHVAQVRAAATRR